MLPKKAKDKEIIDPFVEIGLVSTSDRETVKN
jgi:hypothetical protein